VSQNNVTILATAYDVVAIDGSNFSICPQKLEFRFIRLGVLQFCCEVIKNLSQNYSPIYNNTAS